jgi:TniQ
VSKADLSSTLWPVHLKPKDDELLSSWLVRLAIAHGMKLHSFCSLTWPGKQIWNRDIDKSADAEVGQTLSEKTGTPLERVRATMLSAYESVLYERHNHFGPTSWIMPIGIYHRIRKQFGLQYCPRCLAEDKEPYYRRKWRLAFMVVCERHHILLHDRCPECEEPVNFHRDELGNHRKLVADSLTLCHACRFDLQTIQSRLHAPATPDEAKFTARLLQAMDAGSIQLSEGVLTYSHLFFTGLRQLIKIVAMRDNRIVKLRQAICKSYEIEMFTPSISGSADFQELGIEARRTLLRIASCLLEEWPQRFVERALEYRLWSSLWLRHSGPTAKGRTTTLPFWFLNVVHDYLYRAKYCPSDEEIAAVVNYLRRKGEVVNKSTIARLLGVSVVRRPGEIDTF